MGPVEFYSMCLWIVIGVDDANVVGIALISFVASLKG